MCVWPALRPVRAAQRLLEEGHLDGPRLQFFSIHLGGPSRGIPVKGVTAIGEQKRPEQRGKPSLQCRRCSEGPSFHGGHGQKDPKCLLHGCTAVNAAEIQTYLRDATREIADLAKRAKPLPAPSLPH